MLNKPAIQAIFCSNNSIKAYSSPELQPLPQWTKILISKELEFAGHQWQRHFRLYNMTLIKHAAHIKSRKLVPVVDTKNSIRRDRKKGRSSDPNSNDNNTK
jgi:hypothetical protein